MSSTPPGPRSAIKFAAVRPGTPTGRRDLNRSPATNNLRILDGKDVSESGNSRPFSYLVGQAMDARLVRMGVGVKKEGGADERVGARPEEWIGRPKG